MSNNAAQVAAETGEERGLVKGNTDDLTRPGRSAGQGVADGLDRVREVAQKDKDARFTALLHHVDFDRLRKAYWAIRPQVLPATLSAHAPATLLEAEPARLVAHGGARAIARLTTLSPW